MEVLEALSGGKKCHIPQVFHMGSKSLFLTAKGQFNKGLSGFVCLFVCVCVTFEILLLNVANQSTV